MTSRGLVQLDELSRPQGGEAPVVAVVQPVSEASLAGILDAVDRGFARALLVGDAARIQAGLLACGRDPQAFDIEPAGDADDDAASRAVALVRDGRAEILMKGHLHTDAFLHPVVDAKHGLRGAGRMSHAFICYLPPAVYHKPLVITDAAMNIAPDERVKSDIARNVIDFLHRLGVACPKVAALAAVETVEASMPATADAHAIALRAQGGEFGDAIVEGPLAFDNAISADAARAKGIESRVAGDPDVLLVPQIEAGNILYKSLVYLSGAIAPGIVLGAKVPLLLTSRTEPPLARALSCAIAARLVRSGA